MNAKDFIDLVSIQVADSALNAVFALLKTPPGAEPSNDDVELSRWFNGLTESDRARTREVAKESVRQTIFNFLTILDGVTRIDNTDSNSRLELTFVRKGIRNVINVPPEELHARFSLRTPSVSEPSGVGLQPYDVDTFSALMEKSRVGDGLDLHHVPEKTASVQILENYVPESAPAIALPKGEHRKLTEHRDT